MTITERLVSKKVWCMIVSNQFKLRMWRQQVEAFYWEAPASLYVIKQQLGGLNHIDLSVIYSLHPLEVLRPHNEVTVTVPVLQL